VKQGVRIAVTGRNIIALIKSNYSLCVRAMKANVLIIVIGVVWLVYLALAVCFHALTALPPIMLKKTKIPKKERNDEV
jgi:hypothetical protein